MNGLFPMSLEGKLFQGLATPWSQLTFTQIIRKSIWGTKIIKRDYCEWLIALWNAQRFTCLIRIESSHLVRDKSKIDGLCHQVTYSHTNIIEAGIFLARSIIELSYNKDEG